MYVLDIVSYNCFFPTDSCKANEYADISMRKFDSIITDYMKEQRIPGGALAITLNGRIIHRQGVTTTY